MTKRTILTILIFSGILFLSSCKFYFNESEYLGTYTGYLESESLLYTSSSGQLNVIDIGDNKINVELITAANPTIYFNGLTVERGYSLNSDNLNAEGNSDLTLWFNRNRHSVYLAYYGGSGSYADYRFDGDRQ